MHSVVIVGEIILGETVKSVLILLGTIVDESRYSI